MEPPMMLFPRDTIYFPEQPDNEPIAERADGHTIYELRHPYAYIWAGPDGKKRCIIVPAGFIYDGASVPRFVWTLSGMSPDGLHRAAALIHDWLYEHKGKLPVGSYLREETGGWDVIEADWQRDHADRMFGQIMREFGVSPWRRKVAYKAVHWFGRTAWRT
jgi:hypothetical protein